MRQNVTNMMSLKSRRVDYVTYYLICTVISTIFTYLVDVRMSRIGLFAVIIAGYI